MSSSPPKLPRRRPAPPRDRRQLDSVRRRLRFVPIPHISDEEAYNFSIHVRPKYLQYWPDTLHKLSTEQLRQVLEWYRWPPSQPRNSYEWTFVTLVADMAEELLKEEEE